MMISKKLSNFQASKILTFKTTISKTVGAPNIALADFIAPKEIGNKIILDVSVFQTGFE